MRERWDYIEKCEGIGQQDFSLLRKESLWRRPLSTYSTECMLQKFLKVSGLAIKQKFDLPPLKEDLK